VQGRNPCKYAAKWQPTATRLFHHMTATLVNTNGTRAQAHAQSPF
jgi:hypothetical protein